MRGSRGTPARALARGAPGRAPAAAPRVPRRVCRPVRSGRCAPPAAEPHHLAGGAGLEAKTAAEDEANRKRWQESGGGEGSADEWRWSLNWDRIEPNIVVGACPRSPADVDVLADAAGATAIVCLQSDLCLEALEIDLDAVRLVLARATQRGLVHARVAVRDFDHADQALMLPEAVRALATLLALGHTVYVHCTAGINRATLTVVGYYTFARGWALDDAVAHVKAARPQAHPYIDCWRTVRARLLEGRGDEVTALARELYVGRRNASGRDAGGDGGDAAADWRAAETALITRTFERQVECSVSLVQSARAVDAAAAGVAAAAADEALEVARADALAAAEGERRAGIELDVARSEIAALAACERPMVGQGQATVDGKATQAVTSAVASAAKLAADGCLLDQLDAARAEVAALRAAIQDVVTTTGLALDEDE